MKNYIAVLTIVGLCGWNASAQTAAGWVSQGQTDLASHNIVGANASFAQALAVNPAEDDANALYAITRLLVLPYQPAGSNFLTRVGFPTSGRNIYSWGSTLPKDANGRLIAPVGVSADEFTAQLRTNVLQAIAGAIANLTAVTDTNYTITLTSAETTGADVTVDYGDLKLIQAALYGSEYFIYTLNAQNLDAQLSDIRALYTNGNLSAASILNNYPELFTFATTNDLQAAKSAFTNAVNCYMTASAFIRARPTSDVRLFNYDKVSAHNEADFRLTLQELADSLALGPQWLSVKPNLSVDMSALSDPNTTWRGLLPGVKKNSIELGTFPDLTFGGLIYGLSQDQVEGTLSHRFTMLPMGSIPALTSSNTVNLTFSTLTGHDYVLESSGDLVNWHFLGNFIATNVTSQLVDSASGIERYYRLRDDSAFIVFSGVVLAQASGLPIGGAEVLSVDDGTSTFTDTNGQFYLVTTLSSTWGDEFQISAPGYGSINEYYGGLSSGLYFYLSPPPANDNFVARISLSGPNVSTNGNNTSASVESGEPTDNTYGGRGGKSVWYSWTAPSTGSYLISVSSTGMYMPILAVYTGTTLSSLSPVADVLGSGNSVRTTLNLTGGQTYQVEVDDYFGDGGPFVLTIAP